MTTLTTVLEGYMMNRLPHLALADIGPTERQLSGLKLVFAKVALDLPFPVPGGAGVDAESGML